MSDRENALERGVAVKTIRRWRSEYQRQGRPRGGQSQAALCPRCHDGPLDGPAYVELLGWYLGDGWVTTSRRGVFSLHIINDQRYVHDNARLQALVRRVKPGSHPHVRRLRGAVITTASWKHWPCVIPQHGPGRKHERPIALHRWQQDLVEQHPADFLRGLLHSDGSRVNNWATRVTAHGRKRYDYPRWQFSNTSADIRGLCEWALDLVGVSWRRSSSKHVSVSTRAGVARLDELVGRKS